ncbi:MAG: HAD-IC family P-type ATPase [Patescibacteria group bacterium]
MGNQWYAKTSQEVFDALQTNEHGLMKEEAARRLAEHGPNKLPEAKADGHFVVFLRQFQSPLIYVLLAAAAVVFAMGEVADGSIILAVLVFNALVGVLQEGKAQSTLRALKTMVATTATVVRDGEECIIPDTEAVLGDILVLQEGEKIPADARVIVSQNLKVDEAVLTGESKPVHKMNGVLEPADLSPAEQHNIVFKGTHIVAGNGRAIVVAVGVETHVGTISQALATIDTEIPLKGDIRFLSRAVISVVAVFGVSLFMVGIALGKTAREMFTTIVSLSVSVIPEGLPIVLTLILAGGVWRMSKRNALVKKLQAVEALGQARVIAVDKTGTITKNEMTVREAYVDGKTFAVSGVGYEPDGEVTLDGGVVDPPNHPELLVAGKIAAFCAGARVVFQEDTRRWRVAGDPTEAALLVFSRKLGYHKDDLERESPLVGEIPFDYRLKYHATVHAGDAEQMCAVVGAPEVILGLSENVWRGGKIDPLSAEEKRELESVFIRMSEGGLRVVALAERRFAPRVSAEGAQLPPEPFGSGEVVSLAFVGFLGIQDALRPEVKDALERAVSAGMRVVMITGDHTVTAHAIAKEAGIWREGDTILTGSHIDALSDVQLETLLAHTSVFARVTPEHKLRIIRAFKARKEIIAMTGDGVNDAPSLVAADLGVAMGGIGTEVAKEAADIVLLDDNFGSIVSAVEEGRSIYKTIKKVILYLFSTSVGEVLAITGALLLGYPLPLLAAQIIWLNFVTDGFLDVALAMEPKEKGLLSGSFVRPKRFMVDALMARRIVLMALPMMVGTLLLFQNFIADDMTKAWTIALTTLAVFQWFNAWNCRSERESLFAVSPFTNPYLIGATAVVIVLQLLAVYHPAFQAFLHTTPLSLAEWLVIIPVAFSIVIVEEVRKFFFRRTAA